LRLVPDERAISVCDKFGATIKSLICRVHLAPLVLVLIIPADVSSWPIANNGPRVWTADRISNENRVMISLCCALSCRWRIFVPKSVTYFRGYPRIIRLRDGPSSAASTICCSTSSTKTSGRKIPPDLLRSTRRNEVNFCFVFLNNFFLYFQFVVIQFLLSRVAVHSNDIVMNGNNRNRGEKKNAGTVRDLRFSLLFFLGKPNALDRYKYLK
jgi:hypothetical protein